MESKNLNKKHGNNSWILTPEILQQQELHKKQYEIWQSHLFSEYQDYTLWEILPIDYSFGIKLGEKHCNNNYALDSIMNNPQDFLASRRFLGKQRNFNSFIQQFGKNPILYENDIYYDAE